MLYVQRIMKKRTQSTSSGRSSLNRSFRERTESNAKNFFQSDFHPSYNFPSLFPFFLLPYIAWEVCKNESLMNLKWIYLVVQFSYFKHSLIALSQLFKTQLKRAFSTFSSLPPPQA